MYSNKNSLSLSFSLSLCVCSPSSPSSFFISSFSSLLLVLQSAYLSLVFLSSLHLYALILSLLAVFDLRADTLSPHITHQTFTVPSLLIIFPSHHVLLKFICQNAIVVVCGHLASYPLPDILFTVTSHFCRPNACNNSTCTFIIYVFIKSLCYFMP